MVDYFIENYWLFWLLIMVICMIMELISTTFYIICFSVGAVAGLISSLLGVDFLAQVVLFVIFSLVGVVCVRPFLIKYLRHGRDERLSNVEALIGRTGLVIEEITPQNSGYVKVDGDEWRALSIGDTVISKGKKVKIVSMDSIVVTVEEFLG